MIYKTDAHSLESKGYYYRRKVGIHFLSIPTLDLGITFRHSH